MIKIFGSVLLFFYNICNSYGGAILLFGLLVKLIMLPFQMKRKHSMMRTTMLTPRVKELEKRYATNKQKYQEEVAKLYKEAKINPMSGCLWTLIPFPIVIILYSVVRQPLVALMKLTQENITTLTDVVTQLGYYTAPAKTDAYSQMTIANVLHEHFADIVSNPGVAEFADKLKNINFHFLGLNMIEKPSLMFWNTPEWQNGLWYIALLMFLIPFISAGLTILQTMLSQKMNPPQDAQTAQTSKTMNLVMPLMSIYICFIMPVSMGLYWIEQSVLGIIQEAILNRYYKTKLDAEMAEFNEAQRKKDAEMEAKRAETERLKAEGKTQVNANTSKKRLAAQERNAEEQRLAAIRAAERAAKNPGAELPASQVGTRRFARGRAYVADRYDVTEAEAAAETAEAAAAGEADLEEAKAKLAETEAVETVETVETAEKTAEAPAAEEKE